MIVSVVLAIVAVVLVYVVWNRKSPETKSLKQTRRDVSEAIRIFYASHGSTSKKYAMRLRDKILSSVGTSSECSVSTLDQFTDELFTDKKKPFVALFVLPTYQEGMPPTDAKEFYEWLQESRFDFRVEKDYLSHLKYSVFGLCDSAYGKSYLNVVGRNVDSWMHGLGAQRLNGVGKGDRSADCDNIFQTWAKKVVDNLLNEEVDSVPFDIDADYLTEEEEEQEEETEEQERNDVNKKENKKKDSNLVDLEDLGKMASSINAAKKSRLAGSVEPKKTMLNPTLEKSLTKQGYRIVGSHSGVKICRWTKAMLRGRGGCYKHTMYGIASHQCMETTPSLACANKCVFCIAEGSQVSLEDRSTVSIEKLSGSHSILSAVTNSSKGLRITKGTSIELLDQGTKCCVQLVLEDDRRLVCTPDHQIFTKRGWVEASDLIPKEDFVACDPENDNQNDFMYLRITDRVNVGERKVYDLSVPETHSFLANGIVVHNCWRHHTNPVGTSWKWKMDEPEDIIEGAMNNHYQMIKKLKGVPGVQPERFHEAMNVRHCALSLVGEPIMYPKINEFLDMLHEKRISSFLVTNAQFPLEIRNLRPCTQLYVSVDAPTKEGLKKIDRPLFSDYWERFNACLDALRDKKQRTVYRLTLVKDYNVEDIHLYGELVKRGKPDFVEIKGVTFCGYTGKDALTMKNVPFQEEVVNFAHALMNYLDDDYDIACEHAHSCSILVANKKFLINDVWHTWIDYEKFHDLVQSGKEFDSLDYVAPTPQWAVYGADEKGFDPQETRHYRNKKKKEMEIAGQ